MYSSLHSTNAGSKSLCRTARVVVASFLATVLVAANANAVTLGPGGTPTTGDANLRLWLDSSVAGSMFTDTAGTTVATDADRVALWRDQSGNSHHVQNSVSGERPILQTLAYGIGGAALNFDASMLERISGNDIGISGNADRTVVTVWQNVSFTGSNYQHAFHLGDASGNEAYGHSTSRGGGSGSAIGNHYWAAGFDSSATANTDVRIAVSTWDGDGGGGGNGLDSWYVDGAAAGASDRAPLATGTDQLNLGSRLTGQTEGLNGYVAEVIVYDAVLSAGERASITSYLTNKYTAAPNLLSDESFEGVGGSGDKDSGTILGAWEVGDPDGLGANSADQVFLRSGDAGRAFTGDESITFYGGSRELHELFQDFATEEGSTYEVRFFARKAQTGGEVGLLASVFDGILPDSGAGPGFQTSVGLTAIESLSISDLSDGDYQFFSFQFTADSDTTSLVFFGDDTTGPELDLDMVGVHFLSRATPEPSTAVLLGLGLMTLGMTGRRRRERIMKTGTMLTLALAMITVAMTTAPANAAVITNVETAPHSDGGINISQPVSPFSVVPNLSSTDYADAASGNGVTVTDPQGRAGPSGPPSTLIDGLWPWDGDNDAPSQTLFQNGLDFSIQFDLQSVLNVDQFNVYTRHTGDRTDAGYDIYGSADATAPTVDGDPTSWTLIASIDSTSGNSPDNTGTSFNGIAGISTFNNSGSLGQFRHLLLDVTRGETFFGEIDIVASEVVTPEPSTLGLFLLGLMSLGMRRRRRRR